MKVELTPTPEKEKAFEPFSVTFTFETEQEACNMWHRLNAPEISFKDYRDDDVNLPLNADGISQAFNGLNKIMFEKGLSKFKP